jgi:glutamine---fructose-6-phosphate transaminase (isomerizing)
MCGIFGACGSPEATPQVVQGLRRLEYRGYDSAGMAVQHAGALGVAKVVGGVDRLAEAAEREALRGTTGLGHTRWATHGKPTERNAHPHLSCQGDLAVVHNGIIANHHALRRSLASKGHEFRSETDTEVFAHLLEECWDGDLGASVRRALPHIEGQYAFAVVHAGAPGRLVVARQGSPMVVGLSKGAAFAASDIPALLEHTRDVVPLLDGQVATLAPGALEVRDLRGDLVAPLAQRITWDVEDAQRSGFPHFMLKEIHDTPSALHAALLGRLDQGLPLDGLDTSQLQEVRRVRILACGSSFYAALAGKRALESLAKVPVEVEVASEFRYGDAPPLPGTLTIAITQSGETADTLAGLRKARQMGDITLALTNVVGSSVTREAHASLLLQAGPEMSVAATKSFTAQLVALDLLGLHLGALRGALPADSVRRWAQQLRALPRAVQQVLDAPAPWQEAGEALAQARTVLYIGRQAGHALAMEGALKLKEISYLHAEGFAAGELKHGPLALVSAGVPVVAIVPPDGTRETMLANLAEVGARDGEVWALAQEGDEEVERTAKRLLPLPKVHPLLFPVVASAGLQLIAYHAAKALGRPIDRPRNLAKSVTVE